MKILDRFPSIKALCGTRTLLGLIVYGLLAAGCANPGATNPVPTPSRHVGRGAFAEAHVPAVTNPVPTPTHCSEQPVEIIVILAPNLPESLQQIALSNLSDQLLRQVHPDAPALTLTAYTLTSDSLNDTPHHVSIPCITPAPIKPDLTFADSAERLRQIHLYNAAVTKENPSLQVARNSISQFSSELKPTRWQRGPIDLAPGLMLVSRELVRTGAPNRYVVIVVKEVAFAGNWCDGCVDLSGAHVFVLGYDGRDGSSLTDWVHQADQLNLLLGMAGAADVHIYRSNETPANLFGRPSN